MTSRQEKMMKKVLLTIGDRLFTKLEKAAKDREITVPELLRSVILPKYFGDD